MSVPLKMWTANILLLLAMLIHHMDASKYLIQSLQDNIGAENFTYYRLHRPGSLMVELTSVEGDVDIYVSTEVSFVKFSGHKRFYCYYPIALGGIIR